MHYHTVTSQLDNRHKNSNSWPALTMYYIPVSEKSFEPDQQMWSYIDCISSVVQKRKM